MFVTLLDRETQQTAQTELDISVFYWVDGNGSCDCNRILAFPDVDEEAYHKSLGVDINHCLGTKRFVVTQVHGDLEGQAPEELVKQCNQGYE